MEKTFSCDPGEATKFTSADYKPGCSFSVLLRKHTTFPVFLPPLCLAVLYGVPVKHTDSPIILSSLETNMHKKNPTPSNLSHREASCDYLEVRTIFRAV